MIVELFGPAGAGKTSFAHALCARLRARGHVADVVLSYRPGADASRLDPGGFMAAARRVGRGIAEIVAMACRPSLNAEHFQIAKKLMKTIPNGNPIWLVRIYQYILRLSLYWSRSKTSGHIVIFDQAFAQAVCTLGVLNPAVNDRSLAEALNIAPRSDLVIKIHAPQDVLESRLQNRIRSESFMERVFEADLGTNLRAARLVERVHALLRMGGQQVICVSSLDRSSFNDALDMVEEQIAANRARSATPATQPASAPQAPPSPPDRSPAGLFGARPASRSSTSRSRSGSEADQAVLGRRLLSASIVSLMVYVAGAGIAYLLQLVVARLIGVDSYGIYSYAITWTILLSYVSTLGFHVSLMRFVPAYLAAGESGSARGVIRYAMRWALVTAFGCAIIGAGMILAWPEPLEPELVASLLIAFAAVPGTTVLLIGSSAVRSLGGVFLALAPERMLRDGLVLMLLLTCALFWPLNSTLVMSATLASTVFAFVVVVVSMRRLMAQTIGLAPPVNRAGEWWPTIFPLTLLTGADILLSRTGVLVLGFYAMHEAGVFGLAYNIAVLITLPRVATSTLFSPAASGLHAREDRAGLQAIFAKASGLSLIGATALGLPLIVLAEPLLSWFGSDFGAGATVIQILVIGQWISASFGPQLSLLTMTGNERAAAALLVVSAGVNVAVTFVAIGQAGILGAAVATSSVLVAWNVAMAIFIYRKLHIVPSLPGLGRLSRARRGAWLRPGRAPEAEDHLRATP